MGLKQTSTYQPPKMTVVQTPRYPAISQRDGQTYMGEVSYHKAELRRQYYEYDPVTDGSRDWMQGAVSYSIEVGIIYSNQSTKYLLAHTSCENDPDLIPWLKRIAKQTANVNVSTETCDLIVQNAPNMVLVAGEEDVSSFTSEEPNNENVSMKNDTSENEGGEDELEELEKPEEPEEPEEPIKPEQPSKLEEPSEANEEPVDKPLTREDVKQSLLQAKAVIDASKLANPDLKQQGLQYPIQTNLATARSDARRNADATVGAKPYAQNSAGAFADSEGEKGDDDDDVIKEEDFEDALNDQIVQQVQNESDSSSFNDAGLTPFPQPTPAPAKPRQQNRRRLQLLGK